MASETDQLRSENFFIIVTVGRKQNVKVWEKLWVEVIIVPHLEIMCNFFFSKRELYFNEEECIGKNIKKTTDLQIF